MPIRLLVLDVDGTLVDLEDRISSATLAALARVRAAGIPIMIATGRRYSRAFPIAARVASTLPVVTASGALIKHPDEHRTLFRAEFVPRVLNEMLTFFADAGHEPVLYTDSFGLGYDFHLAAPTPRTAELREFLERNSDAIRIDRAMHVAPPEGVFAGFVIGTREAMLELANELHRRWPDALYVHVIRSPRYLGYMCEIAPVGVSKWSGVRHVAELLGVADREICAVGDDVNDLPMIAGAGLGIAMGNAPEDVRAAADRITGSVDEEGLVQVAEWILETR